MAEYNPSKIIKDGNTYNFRDTTKIPLAGSNEISGSLIPSTDGTVNLGSSSYQWNNVYIKSLTINGVACGDILTHNASEFANDSDVVHKSGDETIDGVKKFSGVLIGIDNFNIQGGSDWDGGARLTLNKKTESMSAILQTFSNTDSSAYVYDVNNFYPYKNNNNNLGTSTNKWKSFNGINPGALSLPDYTQSVTLSFAINSPFEIPFNGFIRIQLNVSNYSYLVIYVNNQEAHIGQSALKSTLAAFIPVSQNDVVKINVTDGEYAGYGNVVLFKNKGNS